jgi:hypothetical protein
MPVNLAGEVAVRGGPSLHQPEQLLVWKPGLLFLDAQGLTFVSSGQQRKPDFYRNLNAVTEKRFTCPLPLQQLQHEHRNLIADAYDVGKCSSITGGLQRHRSGEEERRDLYFSFGEAALRGDEETLRDLDGWSI